MTTISATRPSTVRAAVRLDRLVWAALLLPLVLGIWSARDVMAAYSPAPFSDHFITMLQWRDIVTRGLTFQDLFSQHNEHRIFFPRLVFFADLAWFQGRNVLNLVAIGAIQLLGAAFYLRVAEPRTLRPIGVLGLTVAISLMFWLRQWENFFWAFQVQFVGVQVAAAWALFFFCRANAKDEPSPGLMAASIAMLVVATFTLANGVMAGAAMVATSMVARRGGRNGAVALAATAALLAIYLHDYHRIPIHAPPGLAFQHPGRFAWYVLNFLGNGWTWNNPLQPPLAGLIGAAATAGMAVVVWRDRGSDGARTALFGMAIFIGLTAALTSFGRLNFGVEQSLSSRYVTPTAHFWASQVLFWALTAQRSSAIWFKGAVGAGVLLVGLLTLPLQVRSDAELLGRQRAIRLGDSALLTQLEDPTALKEIYPDPKVPLDVAPFLRKARLSVFAAPLPPAVGSRFTAPKAAPELNLCRGALDGLTSDPAVPPAARAEGWGWDMRARRTFEHVVLVDDTGQVLGVGLSGVLRRDVKKAVREVRTPSAGWIAAMTHGPGRQVIAYGMLADGRACELGRKTWP